VWRSQFCLFLVVFPVSCISSVSPRFYFRKHVFCFLPLVTILEPPQDDLLGQWNFHLDSRRENMWLSWKENSLKSDEEMVPLTINMICKLNSKSIAQKSSLVMAKKDFKGLKSWTIPCLYIKFSLDSIF
jgi:hypothetical protein